MIRVLTFAADSLYMGLYRALADNGTFIRYMDLREIPYSEHRDIISKLIDEVKPHLVFTVGRPELYVNFDVLVELCQNKGIFHVYWATEDRGFHEKYSMTLAPKFDFVFSIAEECVQEYKKIGQPSALLRYGCYPSFHRKLDPVEKLRADITIAANYYQGLNTDYVNNYVLKQENEVEKQIRMQGIGNIIYPLIEKDYNLTVWGWGWESIIPQKFIRGYLPYENLPHLYNSAKIVLGLEWNDVSETKTTGRPFEVLGCGAFFITYRTRAICNLFIDRTQLALTQSADETVRLVDYFLQNAELRNNIAMEGQREVYAKHTYHQRAREFIDALQPYLAH